MLAQFCLLEGTVTKNESDPLYVQVRDELAGAIRKSEIPGGVRITESMVAQHFEVSRQTARYALGDLQAEGLLLSRAGRRGFLVSSGEGSTSAELETGTDARSALSAVKRLTRTQKWERNYGRIKAELLKLASRGEFKIVPSNLAERYEISRTVLRDIQLRLVEDGIVRLEGQQWILNRFDAWSVAEQFAVRILLEPFALKEGFERIPRHEARDCLERLQEANRQTDALTSELLERMENDLHDRMLSYCGNSFLMDVLRRSRLVHVFNSYYYPIHHPQNLFTDEHIPVFEAILAEDLPRASKALVAHLEASLGHTRVRLDAFAAEAAEVKVGYVKPLTPDYRQSAGPVPVREV